MSTAIASLVAGMPGKSPALSSGLRTTMYARPALGHRSGIGGLSRFLALLMTALAVPAHALSDADRTLAAQQTVKSNPACTTLNNFYWEIGDRYKRLASGSRGLLPPSASTQMAIYSAGKWMHAAYAFQLRSGNLSPADIRALNMTAGYTAQGQCTGQPTVGTCQLTLSKLDPTAVGKFSYGPGHFQYQATKSLGLGGDGNQQLAAELVSRLGGGFKLSYTAPQLAGGARSSAADYAIFLRRILDGQLMLGALGANAVCTYTGASDPATGRKHCDSALNSPAADPKAGLAEAMDYSLGHWVENDPVTGDGAFSSPGAAGFYPWIDAGRTYYGILARSQLTGTSSANSVKCGRLIRKAWLTGQAP